MPWALLLWLLVFIMQSGLLGASLFAAITLSDLKMDLINPHEASANINRLVVPEYATQIALTALVLLTGHWLFAALQLALAAWHVRQYLLRRHLADVTEIHRHLDQKTKLALYKVLAYVVSFIWVIYSLIHTIITMVSSPEGRIAAQRVIREAAAALH